MNGSWIAENIERDMRREQYYKNKKRAKCIIDKKRQCDKCRFQKICEDVEYERDNSIESD